MRGLLTLSGLITVSVLIVKHCIEQKKFRDDVYNYMEMVSQWKAIPWHKKD